ncbi:uncharacterized protein [Amphiura filiformis]|uniref:uncharacterized protein n=1 Tax=Amphiura filiformis TaxID=82378 RepID=UPI003B226A57
MASTSNAPPADQQRQRNEFRIGRSQVEVLQQFWEEGMNSASTPEMKDKISDAANQTQLTEDQVKNWIYKEGRKKRQNEGTSVRSKQPRLNLNKKQETETQTLYRFYRKREMTGKSHHTSGEQGNLMKKVNKDWKRVKKSQKKWQQLKDEMQESGPGFLDQPIETLTDKQKRGTAEPHYEEEIEKYCLELEQFGYHTLVLSSHPYLGQELTGDNVGLTFKI